MREDFIKEGKLFKKTNSLESVASLGYWGVEEQFYLYIEGYKLAADTLIKCSVDSDKHIESKLIYPIVFCYRQYLELTMKDLFLMFSNLTEEKKKDKLNKKGHSLTGIWNCVYEVIKECIADDEKKDFYKLENLLKEFHDFDTRSDSFRYPINRDLDLHHEEWNIIDINNLFIKMNEIHAILKYIKFEVVNRRENTISSLG